MKRSICLMLLAVMLLGLCACGQAENAPQEAAEWSRTGYFSDENNNILYVLESSDEEQPGWTVGVIFGEEMFGWVIPQEGSSLHGNLKAWDENEEPYVVTVSEEGEAGLLLEVEGGETYHFLPMEVPKASIFVSINTEGLGSIAYAEGETAPEIDPERPYQSAQINLAEPAAYTFVAWPNGGNRFVKWTKNGEDFYTEKQITVMLDESADYAAVFEPDPDWQNPVMNFVGEYQSGRAHALVECFGDEEALITIEWGGSAWELARWLIIGKLDTETLTIDYSGSPKTIVVYDDNGEVKSEETEYEDGSGTVTFHEDGSFTWHDDQSEYGEDMLFERLPVQAG